MPVARRQRTIARPVTVTGFGYFSGRDIQVEFWPAVENAGVTFVRHDLGPGARIPATAANRIDMPRRTTLVVGDARVEMVEHIMAALHGLRVDNCEVWVDAAEMPGCDGSAQPFVEAIQAAGIVEQRSPVRQIVVRQTVRVGSNEQWIEAQPSRGAGLSITYDLNFASYPAIGRQTYGVDVTPNSFCRELAACRTFITDDVAQAMLAEGRGQRVTPQDLLIFGPHGPIENTLRFVDECVRHKVLDVVGDLALAGCEIIGHVVAHRCGHKLNAELAKRLLEQVEVQDERNGDVPLKRAA